MAKKVSKRRTETEAQQVLAEQVRSGLSDRAFGRKKGKRLERSGRGEAFAFVEVKPKAVVPTEVLEVQLSNGRVVSVSAAIEPMVLARLLDAIGGRTC